VFSGSLVALQLVRWVGFGYESAERILSEILLLADGLVDAVGLYDCLKGCCLKLSMGLVDIGIGIPA